MLTEPLPNSLDVRKAAARGVSISGVLKPLDLQRFSALLAEDAGSVQAILTFSRDDENRYLINVSVTADVVVMCQRCLEPMPLRVESENLLAVVWDDEYARQLPRRLEPLIVDGEKASLWEVVEDELMLSMPTFSYHDDEGCNKIFAGISQPEPEKEESSGKPNPFNVLEQLKPGKKH